MWSAWIAPAVVTGVLLVLVVAVRYVMNERLMRASRIRDMQLQQLSAENVARFSFVQQQLMIATRDVHQAVASYRQTRLAKTA